MENPIGCLCGLNFAKRSAKMDRSRTDFGKLRFYSGDSFSEKVRQAAFGQRGSVSGQAA